MARRHEGERRIGQSTRRSGPDRRKTSEIVGNVTSFSNGPASAVKDYVPGRNHIVYTSRGPGGKSQHRFYYAGSTSDGKFKAWDGLEKRKVQRRSGVGRRKFPAVDK